jgi:uncharacterized protein (DUF433 family)
MTYIVPVKERLRPAKVANQMLASDSMRSLIPLSGRYLIKACSHQSRKEEAKMAQFDRITTNVARMNGEPCIRDLRVTVRRVLEALATYPDRTELKREYPELEDEDIRQALAFAAALVDDKILPLPQTR